MLLNCLSVRTLSNSATVLDVTCVSREAVSGRGVCGVSPECPAGVCRRSLWSFGQPADLLFAELHLFYQKITVHGETSFIYKTYL